MSQRGRLSMSEYLITDAPEQDWPEIQRMIDSHGSALVLRYEDKLGSDAKAALLAYHKEHDTLPPYDIVLIEE